MNPSALIPAPDVLPAPWGLFTFLLLLTFTVHLLLANIMLGGLAVSWFNSLKRRRQSLPPPSGQLLARRLTWVIALAINFGVAPLLFLQVAYGQFIYVSTVLMAVYWVSIVLITIVAYYLAYLYDLKYQHWDAARPWLSGIAAFLFAVVGYFFTNSLVLMINPVQWPSYFQHPWGMLLPSLDPSLLPRYLHFLASSLAIGGLAVALWGWYRRRRGEADGQALLVQGTNWYGVFTVLNFVVGAWYLAALPEPVLGAVVASRLALLLLMLAVVCALASVPAALGRHAPLAAGCALAAVVLMVLLRHLVRSAYLSPYLQTEHIPVQTQYSPVLLFVAVAVLGVALVVYLLKVARAAGKEVGA